MVPVTVVVTIVTLSASRLQQVIFRCVPNFSGYLEYTLAWIYRLSTTRLNPLIQ